jgi:hypothetical protein
MGIIIIQPSIHLSHLSTRSSGLTFPLIVEAACSPFHPIGALSLQLPVVFSHVIRFRLFVFFFFALFRVLGLSARDFSSSGAGSSNFIRSSGGAHGVSIQWLGRRLQSRRKDKVWAVLFYCKLPIFMTTI